MSQAVSVSAALKREPEVLRVMTNSLVDCLASYVCLVAVSGFSLLVFLAESHGFTPEGGSETFQRHEA